MNGQKVAFVFAHPAAHELLVAGLMQRSHADVLFVTQADSGSPGSSDIARECLEELEVCRSLEFLEMSEVESYSRAFRGDLGYYTEYRHRILDWLLRVQPDVIYGDAFELTNFHHDLTRMLLDDAIREYQRHHSNVENYEIAIASRTSDKMSSFLTQEFTSGSSEVYQPTPEEVRGKEMMLKIIGKKKPAVLLGPQFYDLNREVYRGVPNDRDYTFSPPEFKRHYDEWGLQMVKRGKYEQAVLFDQHFAPIVRHLRSLDETLISKNRAA